MARKGAQAPDLEKLRNNLAAIALAFAGITAISGSALALSELQQEEIQLPDQPDGEGTDEIERRDLPPPGEDSDAVDQQETPSPEIDTETETEAAPQIQTQKPAMSVPLPDPVVIPRDPGPQPGMDESQADAAEATPEILYDLALLPEPVRRLRELIMEACLSGDIERLRPLIGTGKTATQLSFGDVGGDPVSFLRELSGDEEGHEILAILYEVFSAGYVHLSEGTEEEIYVWPYFFAVPLDALTAPQRVELFKIVTAGDYEDMKNYGAYIFYRAGISPEGRWQFFVAGD